MKLPTVFQRRARREVNQYKATEFRVMGLYFFPLIAEKFEAEEDNEYSSLWLLVSFIFRLLLLPNDEFQQCCQKLVDRYGCNKVEDVTTQFYQWWEKELGQRKCTYNLHLFAAHIIATRRRGSFDEYSALPFESSYRPFLESFKCGTRSLGKQAMTNMQFRRATQRHHSCRKTGMSFGVQGDSEGLTSQNNLARTRQGNFYELRKETDNDGFIAKRIILEQFQPMNFVGQWNRLWEDLGVYHYHGTLDEDEFVPKADLVTHAVLVHTSVPDRFPLIMTVPAVTLIDV